TDVLTVGILVTLAAYLVSPLPTTIYSAREIVAVLPFGAVLAGRVLGDRLAALRLLPLACVVLAGYCVALLSGMAQPTRAAVGQTLAGGGAVQLRAPDWTRHGALRGAYASRSSWFDPRLHDATFVVSTKANGWGFWISYRQVTGAFGKPVHTYHYGGYTIWAWHENLLARLHPGD